MHPRARLVKILTECQDVIATVDFWNANRPEQDPMDCEPERIIADMARRGLEAWDRGDMDTFGTVTNEMLTYGVNYERRHLGDK